MWEEALAEDFEDEQRLRHPLYQSSIPATPRHGFKGSIRDPAPWRICPRDVPMGPAVRTWMKAVPGNFLSQFSRRHGKMQEGGEYEAGSYEYFFPIRQWEQENTGTMSA